MSAIRYTCHRCGKTTPNHHEVCDACAPRSSDLDRAIATIIASLRSGGTLYACGNGGSDAHAGHLVAELVGRYAYDRSPLRAVHLSSGGPVGSCIANDYGWSQVFARQVTALCTEHDRKVWPDEGGSGCDALVCFTTSGKSRNIHEAVRAARGWSAWPWPDRPSPKGTGADAIVFSGPAGLVEWSDVSGERPMETDAIVVRSTATTTPAIQEQHQAWVHETARRVEEALCPR